MQENKGGDKLRENHTRLMIGTAQWGLDYGISNNQGKTDNKEIQKILDIAQANGINSLDTASAYGNAEKITGKLARADNIIVTKISIGNQDREASQISNEIRTRIKTSYADLGGETLEGILVHDPDNLEKREHSHGWDTLIRMKEEGFMKKIGISVYHPRQAELLSNIYKPDIIQIPFNAFDQRGESLGILKQLKENGVEIHARSIFLQGLLLMDLADINDYFMPWRLKIKRWHKYCSNNKITLLQGAVANAMREKNIDKFIVGVENMYQLEEIVEATKKTVHEYFQSSYSESEEGLINPTKWLTNK